jgi:L-serine dehydratase
MDVGFLRSGWHGRDTTTTGCAMFLSAFDLFKVGIGPSSSHTMGPMTAAARFLADWRDVRGDRPARVQVTLYGSLAHTGRGHGTDRAVILGLAGLSPESVDPAAAEAIEHAVRATGRIGRGDGAFAFDPAVDLVFDLGPPLEAHPNGLVIRGLDAAGTTLHAETYFSVGGGFVETAAELTARQVHDGAVADHALRVPYPFDNAAELLAVGARTGLTIAEVQRANERAVRGAQAVDLGLARVWEVMDACIARGLVREGRLPGGLAVERRAAAIHRQLVDGAGRNDHQPHAATDWLWVYAMAVNEENAAGGQVVTAPTNGAAGVVPATIRYYRDHCVDARADRIADFLLTAAAIGGIIKRNASISGAEVGCQGEVGSAAAMAAAGLCAVLGGTNAQIENAAEIALEHHLGMTCDPAGGLVQVPCIERNGLGAIKAVAAASLALRGDGRHFMPLDNCIETMRQTGLDMSAKYKETSTGGLAVNLPEC